MKKVLNMLNSKGKILIMPLAIFLVLIAIYVFNSFQKNDSAILLR